MRGDAEGDWSDAKNSPLVKGGSGAAAWGLSCQPGKALTQHTEKRQP